MFLTINIVKLSCNLLLIDCNFFRAPSNPFFCWFLDFSSFSRVLFPQILNNDYVLFVFSVPCCGYLLTIINDRESICLLADFSRESFTKS